MSAFLSPPNPPTSAIGVAVEKLLRAKFAKIKLPQDALQTTFSIFLDIFYPPNFRCFEKNGVFQQPRLITTGTVLWRCGYGSRYFITIKLATCCIKLLLQTSLQAEGIDVTTVP